MPLKLNPCPQFFKKQNSIFHIRSTEFACWGKMEKALTDKDSPGLCEEIPGKAMDFV